VVANNGPPGKVIGTVHYPECAGVTVRSGNVKRSTDEPRRSFELQHLRFDALKDLDAAQIASPRKLLNSLFFFLIGTIWRCSRLIYRRTSRGQT
jgi:hypothetical protein